MPINWQRFGFKDFQPGYHVKTIESCRWNCDGVYLGSCSQDKQTKIGQIDQTGQVRPVHTIPSQTHVSQIAWHPTETGRFITAGDDRTIELWDVRASRATSKITTLGSNISMSWSPDGKYLGLGNGVMVNGQACDRVVVVDLNASKWIKRSTFGFEINELDWGANSTHLLVATEYGNIDVLSVDADVDSQDMTLMDSFTAHTSNCIALKTDNEYRRMAVGSADFNLSLWQLDEMICTNSKSFESVPRVLAFSGDGSFLAVAPDGPLIHIVDTNTVETVHKVDCQPQHLGAAGGSMQNQSRTSIAAMAWHPKQPIIAIGVKTEGKVMAPVPFLKLVSFINEKL